jgi:hypothetical protein
MCAHHQLLHDSIPACLEKGILSAQSDFQLPFISRMKICLLGYFCSSCVALNACEDGLVLLRLIINHSLMCMKSAANPNFYLPAMHAGGCCVSELLGIIGYKHRLVEYPCRHKAQPTMTVLTLLPQVMGVVSRGRRWWLIRWIRGQIYRFLVVCVKVSVDCRPHCENYTDMHHLQHAVVCSTPMN